MDVQRRKARQQRSTQQARRRSEHGRADKRPVLFPDVDLRGRRQTIDEAVVAELGSGHSRQGEEARLGGPDRELAGAPEVVEIHNIIKR